jgi:hypothetical protein
MQRPDDHEAHDAWDVPARPGDRFGRGDEYAALDFLGLLGIAVDATEQRLVWPAPLWRKFRIEPPADEE